MKVYVLSWVREYATPGCSKSEKPRVEVKHSVFYSKKNAIKYELLDIPKSRILAIELTEEEVN